MIRTWYFMFKRQLLGLTANEVAHKSNVNIRTYQRLEQGYKTNYIDVLKVMKVLDISVEELIEDKVDFIIDFTINGNEVKIKE